MPRMYATASFSTFLPIVPPMSLPSAFTAEAAPIEVFGAITAKCPAMVMNVPALAALPPAGAT